MPRRPRASASAWKARSGPIDLRSGPGRRRSLAPADGVGRLRADPGPRRSQPVPAEARRRHRDQALPAAVGQRLRDGGEPARDALLPPRAVGSGHAPADGRDAHGRRDRRRAAGGRGRPRRRGCHASWSRSWRSADSSNRCPSGWRRAWREPSIPLTPAQRKIRTFLKTLSIEWTGADRFVRWWYRTLLWPFFRPAGAAIGGGDRGRRVSSRSSPSSAPGDFTLGSRSAPVESLILLGLGLRADVLPRARPRRDDRPLRAAGEERRVHDLLRFSGVLRRSVRQPDARSTAADHRSRSPVRSPSWSSPASRASRWSLFRDASHRRAAVQVRAHQLLRDLPEPDPAAGARRLLDPVRPDPGAGPPPALVASSSSTTCWHKLRTRERLTKQEVGLGLYAVLGIAFTIFSLLHGLLLLEAHLRWPGLIAVERWPRLEDAARAARRVLRRTRDPRPDPARSERSFDASVRVVRGLVFRAESRWRVEAAELIDALPAFDDLPVEILNDLAGRVTLRRVRAGQPVFRQGDRPTAFYVVRHGQVRRRGGGSGYRRRAGTRARSSAATRSARWGCWRRRHGRRPSASIDDGELFEIDKGTFDRLLADSIHAPGVRADDAGAGRAAGASTVRGIGDARASPSCSSTAAGRSLPPGTPLVTRGRGVRSLLRDPTRDRRRSLRTEATIRTLEPGSHFGEIGLLRSAPRSATVTVG